MTRHDHRPIRTDRPERHTERWRARRQHVHRGIQPTMNPNIFKAYDVRGIYPTELDEQIFHQIGRAFVAYLKAQAHRRGPRHARVLAEPRRRLHRRRARAGRRRRRLRDDRDRHDLLRGRHRRPRRRRADHRVAQSEAVQRLQDGGPRQSSAQRRRRHLRHPRHDRRRTGFRRRPQRPAASRQRSILDGYVKHVLGFIDPSIIKPFKVVLDAGCGMAGLVAPALFKALPCKVDALCFTIDGTFPTHEANPLIEENRARHRRPGARRRARKSASPGTATPIAASSSTKTASSFRAIS